ncbi:hypothetical protein [Bosea sp. (in: a-proteobacteria)]|jgi:hypothetical protein|uniref:hypothetical protein n=1 Tax=Bosea sp. (in: a-proteobacteria) TaxID=1871050 RepID=UPI002DDDB9F7|nr:hypothetical protein [Bosea sp. (in: a-proteobacteria)]HEV2508626.1 hypothetical protein [Bosea sp. (in: a-proteobacteria)]
MRPKIWIDNGAWDWLFDHEIDLSAELPKADFELLITRQIEIEMRMIRRSEVREFAQAMMIRCPIEVRALFGFDDPNVNEGMRRFGGLDEGYWASSAEVTFIRQQNSKREQNKLRGSGLYQHEGDIALAAKSFEDVVITAERRGGALGDAEAAGGRIVRLHLLAGQSLSLRSACAQALDGSM